MKKKLKFLLIFVLVILFSTTINLKAEGGLYIYEIEGASIRTATAENNQGLRFYGMLDEIVKNNEHGFYLVYGETTIETLKIALVGNEEEVLVNGKKVFKVVVNGVNVNNEFSVVLTGIPEAGYLDNISVFAYVLLGEEIELAYPVVRSVGEVALKMQIDGEADNEILNIIESLDNLDKKIILLAGEGVRQKSIIVNANEEIELPEPNRHGHDFKGWKKGQESNLYLGGLNYKVVKNVVMTAQWDLKKYTISYDLNGGEGEGFTDQFKYYSDNEEENADAWIRLHTHEPTKEGCTFVGWKSELRPDRVYWANFPYGHNSDTVMVAQWEIKEYVVSYDLNGGEGEGFDEQIKYYGADPEENKDAWIYVYEHEPTKMGYSFLGWKSELRPDKLYAAGKPYGQNASTVLVAEWKPNEYTISYNLNGGTGAGFTNQIKYYSETEGEEETWTRVHAHSPTRSGYTFLGWKSELRPDKLYKPNAPYGYNANTVMVAQWELANYTIQYVLNGGTISAGYANKTELATALLTDFYAFINPTDTLSTFLHGSGNTSGFNGTWYNNETYRYKMYAANVKTGNNSYFASHSTYQAKWAPFFEMMVEFTAVNPEQNFWGGTFSGMMRIWQYFRGVKPGSSWTDAHMNMMPKGLTHTIYYEYGSSTPDITLPTANKSGYTFAGWYTTATFTGSKVTKIAKGSSGNKTFYAKWEEIAAPTLVIHTKYMTRNDCYTTNQKITVKGVMVHSTAVSGVMAAAWFARWNKSYKAGETTRKVCVHAFLDDKEVWQYLPWNHRGWHGGGGVNGSINDTHIGFEICEPPGHNYSAGGATMVGYDKVKRKPYFDAIYENSIQLVVMLFQMYNLTVTKTSLLSHREGALAGLASNHGDPEHWWTVHHGVTMDHFRADVKARLGQ